MSHNVTITDVKIANLDFVKSAVEELNNELGLNWVCEEDSTIRGWLGKKQNVKLAIKTNTKYDIGFIENDGGYSPVFEDMCWSDFGRYLQPDTDSECLDEESQHRTVKNIGKLLQRINIITAECEAAQCGYTTTRDYNEKTGIMNLVVVN